MLQRIKIREHTRGFHFVDDELRGVLRPGQHWLWGTAVRVDVSKVLAPWIEHPELPSLIKSGHLAQEAEIVDLKDRERALVWIDGRLAAVIGPGEHALWKCAVAVRIERVEVADVRFTHSDVALVLAAPGASEWLTRITVAAGTVGLLFVDGVYRETLPPGVYATWNHLAEVRIVPVDLREQTLDVAGQEILTADKVTLRLNALVTYKVIDPVRAATVVDDFRQALYRDVQLILRAVIGTRELDPLLADKDAMAEDLLVGATPRADALGVEILSLGVKDLILPGDMRELLNKVTEAKKAAEAALITRREETAAARSQANTAKILESSPVLMRLREIEALEKLAEKASFTVILGDGHLADKVVKML